MHLKRSISLNKDTSDGIKKEASRLGRSFSWVLLRAWEIAQKDIEKIKSDSVNDALEGERFEP